MTRKSYHVHCSIEGCATRVGRGQLFCKDHYYSLPKALRDRLWSGWRNAMNAWRGRMDWQEKVAADREYWRAYNACCEYLRTAPKTPADAMATVAIGADGSEVRFVEGRRL